MSDPLRTETSRALEPASEAERDAKIEQLLLAGLDHYFATEYEHAINVWTRALFFDRSHARARAYIERARSALAERQRESEELLQSGVAAFDRGEGGEARRLLDAAMAHGAPSDEALALLDRLNRLDQVRASSAMPEGDVRAERPRSRTVVAQPLPSPRIGAIALGALLLVAAAGVIALVGRSGWRALLELPPVPAAPTGTAIVDTPLPLPARGAMALDRAREFALSGRLHDALAVLDQVRPTDAEKPAADRLRADIQKQLIGLNRPNPR